MERIPKSWRKNYRPLKIYRDDIEKMWAILAQEFSPSVDVRIGQLCLESPEELSNVLESDAVSLYMDVNLSQLELHICSDDAWLSVRNEEDTKAMGVAGRIDQILQERQRFWGFTHFSSLQSIFLLLVGLSVASFFGCMPLVNNPMLFALLFSIYVCILIIIAGVHLWTKMNMAIIHLIRSNEDIGFIKRNKDKLILVLITCIISSMLGAVGMLLVQWLIKKL